MKRIIPIVLALGVLGLIGWRLASNKKHIDEKKKPVATGNVVIPVNVIKVAKADVNDQLIKTGTLIPILESDIMATAGGKLVAVNFELGSYVSKGATIAQIDNKMLQLKTEASELAKSKYESDYKRNKTLLEGDATTEQNVQDIKYNYDNTVNQISQLQQQIADNNIKAPISGQIVVKKLEAGTYVSAGAVLGSIVDISTLKVDVMITEKDAYTLKVGQPVTVTTEVYPNEKFKGTISFISQKGDATHNYQIQVKLPNTSAHPLKAGTYVYVDFARKSNAPLLLIPRTALVESFKNPYVYVVENGKAVVRKITPGREIGNNIEVVDGINEGEEVVVNGQINLSEGASVKMID
ncbi:efflux RND transporter periplasmic adaptor subunit [Chitinophagaceae bacterium 26-R-25]|nr:efflux RND transporter periplasmic adaptor subunit [Chitinophagaceae bacterium 26-R-25]